jgi:glycosyltransferase involved in cell wall biosynthesis
MEHSRVSREHADARRTTIPLGSLRSMVRTWLPGKQINLLAATDCSDSLTQAVEAGVAAGHARRRITPRQRANVLAIRDRARNSGDHEAALSELLQVVYEYPRAEDTQRIVARLLHEMRDGRALDAWLGISRRFPNSMDAFRTLISLTHRRSGADAAAALIRSRFPDTPTNFRQLSAYADACELVGHRVEAEAARKRLQQRAARRQSRRRIIPWRSGWKGSGGDRGSGGMRRSIPVLERLFEEALSRRADALREERRGGGAVVHVVGSLGSGGAERQLVATAIGLKELAANGFGKSSDVALRPVSVLARSLTDRSDGAFFLPDLQRAGIQVDCYRDLEDFNGQPQTSIARPLRNALKLMPRAIAEATIKTTDLLRTSQPEIVHIWQDGMVYAAGLAVLLAGVPRIILSLRSVPPPDRRAAYPIEYDVIFHSMLRAPGVKLAVNSQHAAERYADWLGIDRQQIAVIPNGIQRSAGTPEAEAKAEEIFARFDAQTAGSTFTLGTVMRMDANKQPLLWVDAAARLLRHVPAARFIVVGDGPLRSAAAERAAAHGVRDRFLFVGRTACVWYWLSKMTAFLLLSEHEGLPNVLIEAQLMGLPVITSPAGGAPETLLPEATGIVTSKKPTAEEVASIIADLAAAPERLRHMGATAGNWARTAFPVGLMLQRTIELYKMAGAAAYQAALSPSRPIPISDDAVYRLS